MSEIETNEDDFGKQREAWERVRPVELSRRQCEQVHGEVDLPDQPYILIMYVGYFGPLLRVNLERAGYATRYAFTCAEAIAKMKIARPGLLMIALWKTLLGLVKGLEVLQGVRSDAFVNDVPILVVAGEGCSKKLEEARRLGATECFAAPFVPTDLVSYARGIMPPSNPEKI